MIRFRRIAGLALLSLLGLGLAAPIAAQTQMPPGSDLDPALRGHVHDGEMGARSFLLERALKCNCSCGLDTHSCQFQMQCGTSPVWAERIRRSLAAGESVEAIQASFVADFGNTVLMAPPPEGFNLVGYLLPSVAMITAGILVGLLVRGGVRREPAARVTEVGVEDAERLRAALQKLDEAEGPDW
ncbi:MAG TPA: cytochrome c-type biogenesis protein CcmH [Longimicrobiales bacterium]|nr:cytochrome c-type biogenesis protein CcmH [Longimicrobiales bacterium]